MPSPLHSPSSRIAALFLGAAVTLSAGAARADDALEEANRRGATREFWFAIGLADQKAKDCEIPMSERRFTNEFRRLQQRFLALYGDISEPDSERATDVDVAEAFQDGQHRQRASLPPTNEECVAIRHAWTERERRAERIVADLKAQFDTPSVSSGSNDSR